MLQKQNEMFSSGAFQFPVFPENPDKQESIVSNDDDQRDLEKQIRMNRAIRTFKEQMADYPEWTAIWLQIAGAGMLIIFGVYLYASIGFLQLKKQAARLFPYASSAALTLCIADIILICLSGWIAGVLLLSGSLFLTPILVVQMVVVARETRDL